MKRTKRSYLLTIALTVVFILGFMPGQSLAEYPSKPVNFLIPFGVGGSADLMGRALANGTKGHLGQRPARAQGKSSARRPARRSPQGLLVIEDPAQPDEDRSRPGQPSTILHQFVDQPITEGVDGGIGPGLLGADEIDRGSCGNDVRRGEADLVARQLLFDGVCR